MGRVLKRSQNAIFLGLFAVFFALYAQQKKNMLPLQSQISPEVQLIPVSSAPSPSAVLVDLSKKLQNDSFFGARVEGVRVDYRAKEISVQFFGNDAFGLGEFSIRENWYGALDRLAHLIQTEVNRGIKIELIGAIDLKYTAEKRVSDFGESEHGLAFARAEWMARFFERRSALSSRIPFKLSSVGGKLGVRQIEVLISAD